MSAAKRILIVDDDVEMAVIMEEILKRDSYEISLAHDGIQAIEKSKQGKVDLILLDIRMPFFSGFWFCDAFKQRPDTKDIPIIIVSALLDESNVRKAYDAGAAAHLKKPFQPEDLMQLVQQTLSKI
jgi:CheY-like chemotaxis protein